MMWHYFGYSLHLLIGLGCFVSLSIDHSGWFAAKGGMWAVVLLDVHPLSDASLCFRSGFPKRADGCIHI